MNVNCIMIGLHNPYHKQAVSQWINSIKDLVNTDLCNSYGMTKCYEEETHMTLCYGMTGITESDVIRMVRNLPHFKFIKDNQIIVMDKVVVDTFRNEDSIVVKINLDSILIKDQLMGLSSSLLGMYSDNSYPVYHPHITLTYLKPDLTDEQVNEAISKLDINKLKIYKMTNYILSESMEGKKLLIDIK